MTNRTRATTSEILSALAEGVEAGAPLADALRTIARAGPGTAQLARRLSEQLARAPLADALVTLQLIPRAIQPIVALAVELGQVPAALRWAAAHADARRRRWSALASATLAPLSFAALGLLVDPLPQLVLGGAVHIWPLLRPVVILLLLVAVVGWSIPRVWAHRRSWLVKAPLVGRLVALEQDATLAAILASFAGPAALGAAPRIAQLATIAPWRDALTPIETDPTAPVSVVSESFALQLGTGLHAHDLRARFLGVATELERRFRRRLALIARLAAFGVLAVIAAQSARKLFTTPIPGMGIDLDNLGKMSPEMRELEKELENLGH